LTILSWLPVASSCPSGLITVPNNPAVSTRKGGRGAVIGGIIGSLVAPGVGTMIVAAVGGALGTTAGNDGTATAIAADRAGAQANARFAGDGAVSALAGKQDAVRRLVLADPCFSAPCVSRGPPTVPARSPPNERLMTRRARRRSGGGACASPLFALGWRLVRRRPGLLAGFWQ
jgi:hypothetical protein